MVRAAKQSSERDARLASAAKNLGLAAITCLVLFALAEAVIRPLYHPENLGTVLRFDPQLGWALLPGGSLHSVDRARHLDYRIEINSLGLRDREFGAERSAGRRRVVAIGDSFTFGTGVEAFWRYTDIMDRAWGDPVEVINAGVCGYGTDQELLFYERDIRPLRPDVVVLTMMMANDVVNNSLDHLFLGTTPKPRFDVVDGELRLASEPLPAPSAGPAIRLRKLLRRSRFLLFVKRRVDRWHYRHEIAAVAAQSGMEREWLHHSFSHWTVYQRHPDPDLERGWEVTEAVLRRFADRCREDGTRLVVFAFPVKIEVDERWRELLFERAGADGADYDLRRPYERLEDICRSLDVRFVYPVDAFRAAAERRPLYHTYDGHPNPYGHVLAARVLLEALAGEVADTYALHTLDSAHLRELRRTP